MHWQQATEKFSYYELQRIASRQGVEDVHKLPKKELARSINFAQVERD